MGAYCLERVGNWSWRYVAERTGEVYHYARSGRRQRTVIARKFREERAL